MEAQRKVILKSLEEKQVKSSKEADDYDVKVRSVNKILDQLKAGESLFYSYYAMVNPQFIAGFDFE